MGETSLIDAVVGSLTDPFNEIHMGVTAENVAESHGISREAQDEFALESHRRAQVAIEAGRFDEEVVPIEVKTRVIALNEAFAAQSLAVLKDLDLDPAMVDPNGGAIAHGQPIAATGVILTTKILAAMDATTTSSGTSPSASAAVRASPCCSNATDDRRPPVRKRRLVARGHFRPAGGDDPAGLRRRPLGGRACGASRARPHR